MTSAALEAYLKRLERELRMRGLQDQRIVDEARERLVHFLGEFGRRTFGAGGTLDSLTLLEDTTHSNERGGRYLVAFASGTKMIWTVALRGDGAVSFDGMLS
jgi:hypothetical protein